jgi:hypothetical protein
MSSDASGERALGFLADLSRVLDSGIIANERCRECDFRLRRSAETYSGSLHLGDREKPGAERAAKLIMVYYVPPKRA